MALLLNANDSVNRSYTITKPSPNHPLDVNGVGVRTENFFDKSNPNELNAYFAGGVIYEANGYKMVYIPCEPNTKYTVSKILTYRFSIAQFDQLPTYGSTSLTNIYRNNDTEVTLTTEPTAAYLVVFLYTPQDTVSLTDIYNSLMINKGTPRSYEPYGYKIPISSGGVTTNIYLGSTQTTRQIKKIVFDGTENWNELARASGYGYRFSLNLYPTGIQSDATVGVKSYCSHLDIVATGGTYRNDNAYTISDTSSLVTSLGTTDRVADWKQFLADQYATGTPVTVWYVLETETTGIVNEPLMEIGTYADTLSNAASIPTTEGANSITVDTTVQPSEFTATWTGWHNAEVKEYDGSDWQ